MRTRLFSATACLVCGLLAAAPRATAGAGEERAERADQTAPARPAMKGIPPLQGELALSLADAIAMGIENNLDVEIERHAPLIALEEHGVAWGAYDPELFAEYGYSAIQTPTANPLQGSGISSVEQRSWDGRSGLRGLVPWLGARYELGLTGDRILSESSLASLNPSFNSSVVATATMPLMRGLVWNQPWTEVKTRRVLYEARQEDFRRALMDTVQDIEIAYWDLVASDEQRRVTAKSLEAAGALLDQTNTQYEVGVVSKVEVKEAEAGVARREFDLIEAENRYRNFQDALIDRVLGPYLTAESQLEIVPTDRPESYVAYEVDVEKATEKAFTLRPELEAARKEIERLRLQLKFARNQRLPELNLEGSYGYAGLAGENNPDRLSIGGGPPPVIPADPSFRSSFDDYFDSDGALQWSVRGVFSYPLGNRAGRHGVSRGELELRRAGAQYRRAQQDVILQVRAAARNLTSAQQGIEASERERLAAEEQFRAERIRLEQGESTPFQVLQREEDLVDAESRKIGALQVYRNSVARLERAQGTMLRSRNIAVEEAAALR